MYRYVVFLNTIDPNDKYVFLHEEIVRVPLETIAGECWAIAVQESTPFVEVMARRGFVHYHDPIDIGVALIRAKKEE